MNAHFLGSRHDARIEADGQRRFRKRRPPNIASLCGLSRMASMLNKAAWTGQRLDLAKPPGGGEPHPAPGEFGIGAQKEWIGAAARHKAWSAGTGVPAPAREELEPVARHSGRSISSQQLQTSAVRFLLKPSVYRRHRDTRHVVLRGLQRQQQHHQRIVIPPMLPSVS